MDKSYYDMDLLGEDGRVIRNLDNAFSLHYRLFQGVWILSLGSIDMMFNLESSDIYSGYNRRNLMNPTKFRKLLNKVSFNMTYVNMRWFLSNIRFYCEVNPSDGRLCPNHVFIDVTKIGGNLHSAKFALDPIQAQLKLVSLVDNLYLVEGENRNRKLVIRNVTLGTVRGNMLFATKLGAVRVGMLSCVDTYWPYAETYLLQFFSEIEMVLFWMASVLVNRRRLGEPVLDLNRMKFEMINLVHIRKEMGKYNEIRTQISKIADFYDTRIEDTFEERKTNGSLAIRNFNNWVKMQLISQSSDEGSICMDLCGGRGGDLGKWIKNKIKGLVFVDISKMSVYSAISRYSRNSDKFDSLPTRFIVSDCTSQSLLSEIKRINVWYDVVSCQFALNHIFRSEEDVFRFLNNVSCRMQRGSFFIGTITDSKFILSKTLARGSSKFDHDVYTICVTEPVLDYGTVYSYSIKDIMDRSEEYLICIDVLEKSCKRHGLKLVHYQGFREFYQENKIKDVMGVGLRMGFDDLGSPSNNYWDVCDLYKVFIFQKVAGNLEENVSLEGIKKNFVTIVTS